jgi:hypothetical protein
MQEGGGVQVTILILLNKAIKEQEEVRGAEGGDEVILVLMLLAGFKQERPPSCWCRTPSKQQG